MSTKRANLLSSALATAFSLWFAFGCASTGTGFRVEAADTPPDVNDETVQEVAVVFWRMQPDEDRRVAWRDALVEYRARDSEEIIERGDYDAVVAELRSLTELLSPYDVDHGRIPRAIEPLARWIVEHGERRGDEGRVMGASRLLAALGADEAQQTARATRVERWGVEARAQLANPLERYGNPTSGLITVWQQYAELYPSSEVLDRLTELYVEQRDALGALADRDGPTGLSLQELHLAPMLMQRAPLDVAAVYLLYSDLGGAVRRVQAMGSRSPTEGRLVEILERARQPNGEGALALIELSRGFVRARPFVARAICRAGLRLHPDEPAFPRCLASVAIARESFGEATAWYADAVRLAPDVQEIYDEALGRLDQMMEAELFESNIQESRSIARHALRILEERERRWPERPPSVRRDELLLLSGRAEMSAGNLPEARSRLDASLAARENRDAHLQLGLLLERTGEPQEAAVHYRQALDLTPSSNSEGIAQRAELLEHLGDAFRRAGDSSQSTRMYRQALEIWDGLREQVTGPQRAVALVRRGVLLSRLNRTSASERSFAQAMEAAPGWREPYAAILAHLVVSDPDLELAQRVLRRAQYQLTLEPQWKVYFALWVQTIAGRASAEPEQEVTSVFSDVARGDGWSAQLAAFGGGSMDYAQLSRVARGRGQQAEAHFYEGARLLAAGQVPEARAHFEQVLETGMVSFYEYTMAQELLSTLAGQPSTAEAGARAESSTTSAAP